MLNEWSCAGPSRTNVTEAATFEQQSRPSSAKSAHSPPLKHSRVTSPSIGSIPRKLLKRARPQDDIDGEEQAHVQRKKRRLRHELVTSRLSRPYATPATHIIGTKAWRVGAWARQRFAGGKLLRKAAILNWIAMKRKRSRADRIEASERPTGSLPSMLLPNSLPSRASRKSSPPLVPFSLPSGYDAFDYEDDDMDEEGDDEEEEELEGTAQSIHSDFSMLDSEDSDPEFYDTAWSFDTIDSGHDPNLDHRGKEINLVMENERTDEVSIAPTGSEGLLSSLASAIMIDV